MNRIQKPNLRRLAQKFFHPTPAKTILYGFLLLILAGGILLTLPVSSNPQRSTSFIDAMFTAVSAVCVTGLVVVDTNLHWSVFGKGVILLLIQTGALGVMSIVTLFSVVSGKNLGLMQRMTIQESISNLTIKGVAQTFKRILAATLLVEIVGCLLVSIRLIPVFGFKNGLSKGFFHAVSAFCNAGFDIFGSEKAPFNSLLDYKDSPFFLLVTAALIIIGGLGFIAWSEIITRKKYSKFSLHTKLVLVMTGALLVAGTAAFFFFESDNPYTMGDVARSSRLMHAFFHSVTTRTAGFNAMAVADMRDTSNAVSLILMMVGGAPGSTAGGIKVTTLGVLILTVISFSKGQQDVVAFKRRLSTEVIIKAVTIVALAITLIVIVTLVLLGTNQITFLQALYEATSAFGTVGLSTGVTPYLSVSGKLALMFAMILGRIGPFTALVAFASMRSDKKIAYRFAEGEISVG